MYQAHIKVQFINPVLGTISGNKELATEFIVAKHPEGHADDEETALPDVDTDIEKQSTYFARTDGKPHLWNYHIKGFLKEACMSMLLSEKYTKESLKKIGLSKYSYKKLINLGVFVKPRAIFFDVDTIGFEERSLRAETMRGERICLARAEIIPAGAKIEFDLHWTNSKLESYLKEWLDYGQWGGISQWRSGDFGQFDYEWIDEA